MNDQEYLNFLVQREIETRKQLDEVRDKWNRSAFEAERAMDELRRIHTDFGYRLSMLFRGVRAWWWR